MKWSLKWRKELRTGQYFDLLQRGFIKPDQDAPCIDGLEFYLDAFSELSTSRPVGLEIQAIPFTAIAEYFRIYAIQDFDEFLYIIRRMDAAFMDVNSEAQKSEGDKNASRNPNAKNSHKR